MRIMATNSDPVTSRAKSDTIRSVQALLQQNLIVSHRTAYHKVQGVTCYRVCEIIAHEDFVNVFVAPVNRYRPGRTQ